MEEVRLTGDSILMHLNVHLPLNVLWVYKPNYLENKNVDYPVTYTDIAHQ